MSKVGNYLQEHLSGEAIDSAEALKFFSTDMSTLTIKPGLIVYPKNERDVRKTTRFAWQLAERGRIVPITARGAGTDFSGAAIGSGIVIVFPAHYNRIIDVDAKSGQAVVESGANFAKVQQGLERIERFLPPEPASSEYSTIGGAIANNAGGECSFKYGNIREYVRTLRVVLANGEIIETDRISKRDLGRKLGLATFEGEIYRALDALIEENQELIAKTKLNLSKNNAGYALHEIKQKDGSFDLTPLFIGSQGTLGIITEATLESEPYPNATAIVAGFFADLKSALAAATELRSSSNLPASMELVNKNLLDQVTKISPNLLKKIMPDVIPEYVVLAEFDDVSDRNRQHAIKKCKKIFEKSAQETRVALDPDEREALARIRSSQAVYSGYIANGSNTRPLPIIDDGVVPISKVEDLMGALEKLFKDNLVDLSIWGHIGDGNLHVQPKLDLSIVGDRQKVFKLMDEYYKLIVSLDGSTTGEYGDGRLRAPWLQDVYDSDVYDLFLKVKKIFDPYNILNPGVKVGSKLEDIKPLLRSSYTLDHLYNHTPRS
jgi:FAD/FMN-containing dehydrogenase